MDGEQKNKSLPRLLGRAHVELELEKNKGAWQQPETLLNTTTSKTTITTTTTTSSSSKNNYTSQKSNNNNNKPTTTAKIRLTLDGYAAPITSGNFVDLVQRKWYDGMPIVSKQREFYTQFGALQRPGIDTTTAGNGTGRNVVREIPLEIMVNGEPEPVYGSTLDEVGIADLTPTLPVTAYGAVAMLHSVENANDASGPFYIFTLDPTSYQARSFGGSILTGSVATFAYVTDGAQWLDQLEPGDRIVSAKVIDGMENFRASGDR